MALDRSFESLVDAGDIARVRKSLIRALVMYSNEDFEEYRKHAEKHLSGLYDLHDGESLDRPNDVKDEDFDEVKARLLKNFSRERLNFMKYICQELYGSTKVRKSTDQSENYRDSRNGHNDSDKLFFILIAAIICGGGMLAYIIMWMMRH